MQAAAILAIIDGALMILEKVTVLFQEQVKAGNISVEQQAAVRGRLDALRTRSIHRPGMGRDRDVNTNLTALLEQYFVHEISAGKFCELAGVNRLEGEEILSAEYNRRHRAEFKWIPEAPKIPGYYASPEPVPLGKLGEKGFELGTWCVHHAIQFDTKEECQAWCDTHTEAKWTPTEHGFDVLVSAHEPSRKA